MARPVKPRVLFVDWHGVLSTDPFWASIRRNPTHPLRDQLETRLAGMFSSGLADRWMRGALSTDQVIATLGLRLGRRFRPDLLRRRLYADLAGMRVNPDLARLLRTVRPAVQVVVATDNMDCFAAAFRQAAARPRRRTGRGETLATWAAACDGLLCSSDLRVLKAEDPARFFGPWLTSHRFGFDDAVLVDDRGDNLAAFTAAGGRAVRYKTPGDVGPVAEALQIGRHGRWSRCRPGNARDMSPSWAPAHQRSSTADGVEAEAGLEPA